MSANKEQLNKLRDILLNEYGRSLSDEELLSEAIRLSEFAKTILRFKLSNIKNEEIIN
jgi:hypothetical protein